MSLKATASPSFEAKQNDKALYKKGPSDYQLACLHQIQGETDINKHVISHCVNKLW